jgi:hypothetical protein
VDSLEELEIVAGAVWSAVGGVDDGSVTVAEVDPKRFGIEIAAATKAIWLPAQANDTVDVTLSTLRPYKPMDLIIVEKLQADDGTRSVVTGYTEIRNVEINGVNQFNAKNPVSSVPFGSTLSAPRPKVRFDTVQTSPALTAGMTHVGSTIPASGQLEADLIFSGVAVKR